MERKFAHLPERGPAAAPGRFDIHPDSEPLGDLRFRQLLAPESWASLPEAVRRRFAKRLKNGQSAVYCGHIVQTCMNPAGRLLARLLTIVGGPLPLDTDNDGAAAVVTVTEDAAGGGQFWTRQYNRPNGFPQVVHSTKTFSGPTGLEEHVGYGISMSLKLMTAGQRLLFVSDRYFLTVLGRRLALPHALTPGQLTVSHEDLGDGRFEFLLDLTHPVIGALLYQRAVFRDMTEA